MSLFRSARERRLWRWTLAVVAAIYASLGLAGRLAAVLADGNLLGAVFVLAGALILVAIVTQGLKTRPGGMEIVVALGVAVVCLLLVVRLGIPAAERTHLIEYGVVALFVYEALMERGRQGGRVPAPALLALAVTALLGGIDEGIQALLPHRVFDVRDVAFNALAGLMALAASTAVARARRRRG